MNTWLNFHDHDDGELFFPLSLRLRQTKVCVRIGHILSAGLEQRVGQVHGVRIKESKVGLQYYAFLINLTTCNVGSVQICTHGEFDNPNPEKTS